MSSAQLRITANLFGAGTGAAVECSNKGKGTGDYAYHIDGFFGYKIVEASCGREYQTYQMEGDRPRFDAKAAICGIRAKTSYLILSAVPLTNPKPRRIGSST